ncbi:hypothetical protein [Streptomyces sp. NPDC051684]|uniref:hypothetical protein n=1 Tax=Streptomyces sp. NPDC051684 TaxID=3365670 RepID=UPI00379F98A7
MTKKDLAAAFLTVASSMPIRVPATDAERAERGAVLMRGILRGWGISADGLDDHQLNELGELILLIDPRDGCDSVWADGCAVCDDLFRVEVVNRLATLKPGRRIDVPDT